MPLQIVIYFFFFCVSLNIDFRYEISLAMGLGRVEFPKKKKSFFSFSLPQSISFFILYSVFLCISCHCLPSAVLGCICPLYLLEAGGQCWPLGGRPVSGPHSGQACCRNTTHKYKSFSGQIQFSVVGNRASALPMNWLVGQWEEWEQGERGGDSC